MRAKTLVYIIVVLTGIFIKIFGINENALEYYISWSFIILGTLNIIIDLLRNKNESINH